MKEEKNIHFVDCGGNVGQSTKWVLSHYDVAKVDIFEPLEYNFKILQKSMLDQRINIHCKAVWVTDGVIDFYPQDFGKRVSSSLIKGKYNTSSIPVRVQTVDLAKWIILNTSKNHYNILKLDIEGAEYDLLPKLFKNNIDQYIDEWFIEFHGTKTPNYNKSVEEDFYNRGLKIKEWSFCE